MVTKTEKTTVAETKAAPAQATAPAGAPGEQPVGGLSIGDLRNLATIMDVASTRGAFRANEMATVGLLYNKLNQFLIKVAPQQATEPSLASNPTATAQPSKKE
jgi:hypothetical protein